MLRKLFKPKVGDKVQGHLDYGITYEGTVTQVPSEHSPYYIVDGSVTTEHLWTRKKSTKRNEKILVPEGRIKHK